jgi:hypothetical protein
MGTGRRQDLAVGSIEIAGDDSTCLIGQPEGVAHFIEVIEVGFAAWRVDGLQELTARRVQIVPLIGSGAVALDEQGRKAHAVIPNEVLGDRAGSS